jgi:hypothetical protein
MLAPTFYRSFCQQSRLTGRKNGVTMKEPMGKEILKEEDHGFWK